MLAISKTRTSLVQSTFIFIVTKIIVYYIILLCKVVYLLSFILELC